MRNILCYGDSNTYGYSPHTTKRFSSLIRWTGRLAASLGWGYNVIEEGCNGRTTGYADEAEPWKDGRTSLLSCLNTHKPVDLVILMLGTNDMKNIFHARVSDIAAYTAQYIKSIRTFLMEKQEFVPEVLLLAPAVIGEKISEVEDFKEKFDEESLRKSRALVDELARVAEEEGCLFLDVNTVTEVSREDQLHLDEEGHRKLADALYDIITGQVRWPRQEDSIYSDRVEKLILGRRSTRKFLDREVPSEKLEKVIEAGRYAPSGGNSQTTHFLVIRDKTVLDRLRQLVMQEFAKMELTPGLYKSKANSIKASRTGHYVFHYNAPVLIVTANQKDYGNNIADCSCALENMMLMANALDLGSCWINQLKWLNENPVILSYMKELGMGDDERVYGALALGYPDTENGLPNRVALERFGNKVTMI